MFYYTSRLPTPISRPTLINLTPDTTSTLATLGLTKFNVFFEKMDICVMKASIYVIWRNKNRFCA